MSQEKVEFYQVDAFTENVFGGNSAAVVILHSTELEDELMQKIALENNVPMTAFVVSKGNSFDIRWFNPLEEAALCGHATLAAAHIIFHHLNFPHKEVTFTTKSGLQISVAKEDDRLFLNFPVDNLTLVDDEQILTEIGSILNTKVLELYRGNLDYVAVVADEKAVRGLSPDLSKIASLPVRGVIATSQGEKVDVVSRYFGHVEEDQATGSAHISLTTVWASKLGKKELKAQQLSKRGGDFVCFDVGEGRVRIGGKAVTYLVGQIWV